MHRCEAIYSHFGFDLQVLKAAEECSELASALNKMAISNRMKDTRNELLNYESVCEEIADVEIMIEQLKIVFDREHIGKIKDQKLERTVDYIEAWKAIEAEK